MAELTAYLQHLLDRGGSDLHVKVGSPPHVRVDGRLEPAPFPEPTPAELEAVAAAVLPEAKAAELARDAETDLALSLPGVGRFRLNVHRQRGSIGLVVRRVASTVPTLEDLGLPPKVAALAAERSGLVVVAGTAGSGRTTTAAAIVDAVNRSRTATIVTLEDPIEVLHEDRCSLISQREVGSDTPSFAEGVRRLNRHDPDVIVVSEVPDAATLGGVLEAAATGRLVVAVTDGATVAETVGRLLDFFPPVQHRQVRQTLAACLRGVLVQRLLDRADGCGRIPAVELLTSTPRVAALLAEPERAAGTLEDAMAEGEYHGMSTFDQSLFRLWRDGLVSLRDALGVAVRPDELRIAAETAGL